MRVGVQYVKEHVVWKEPHIWDIYFEKQILQYCNIKDAPGKQVSMCYNEDRDFDDDGGMVVKCIKSVFHVNVNKHLERRLPDLV